MRKTIIEKQEKQLRAKLHVIKNKIGMSNEEYSLMLFDNFKVQSSVDLNAHQLIDLIYSLEKQTSPEVAELDKWRKRVMAAIGGYLKVSGQKNTIEIIKAVACRASEYKRFNEIPKQRLIDVYSAFKNKQKTYENVENIADAESYASELLNIARVHAMA